MITPITIADIGQSEGINNMLYRVLNIHHKRVQSVYLDDTDSDAFYLQLYDDLAAWPVAELLCSLATQARPDEMHFVKREPLTIRLWWD